MLLQTQVSNYNTFDVSRCHASAETFHRTTKDQTFCRNEYNVTGLCGRQTCPLANSRYATIRADPADATVLYLYTKTIERAHLPSKLWERQRLPQNYAKALEQVDSALTYWPKFLMHKCKQRLTRLTQLGLRMRRLAKEEARLGERIVPKLAPKVRKREETRERKAESAAKVERAIERELVGRLKSGAYGDKPLNIDEGIWKKVLRGLEKAGEGVRDKDVDEGIEEEQEDYEAGKGLQHEYELEGGQGDVEYVSDIEGESDDGEDVEDWVGRAEHGSSGDDGTSSGSDHETEQIEDEKLRAKLQSLKRKRPAKSNPRKVKRKGDSGPKTNIELEIESEHPPREALFA